MASRIDRMIGVRTERRRAAADARVEPLLRQLRSGGFDLVVIGSLARREYKSHSDVDFLVRGDLDTKGRAKVERAVAAAMRGSGVSYDLIMRATSLLSGLGSSNVISSKHPAFAKLATKLDRAGQELGKIDGYFRLDQGFRTHHQ